MNVANQRDHDSVAHRVAALTTGPGALAIATPTLVGALLALWGIGSESLWLDEATSIVYARMPWSDFWPLASGSEVNQTLYYVLLRAWVTFGTSEVWVRTLSALFAVASIPVFQALAGRLFGARTAIVAALLLATSPFFVAFAQEARGYSLAVLLTTCASLLLVLALDRPTPARWAGYALLAGASLYAHLFAGFVIAAQVLAVLVAAVVVPDLRHRWGSMLAAQLGVALLAVPIVLVVAVPGRNYIGHVPAPSLLLIARAGYTVTGSSVFLAVAATALVGFGVLASIAAWRRIDAQRGERFGLLLAWSWFLVPPLASLAVSLLKPIFYPRYLLVMLPGLSLVMAIGLVGLRPSRLAGAALAAVLALTSVQLAIQATESTKEDWRGAAASVLERTRPGDGVIFMSPSGAKPFAYYVEHQGRIADAPTPIYPRVVWGSPHPAPAPQPSLGGALERVIEHDRIWLVVNHEVRQEEALDQVLVALRADHVEREVRDFVGVEVHLWERGPSAAPELARVALAAPAGQSDAGKPGTPMPR